jgi:hypothetical protein
VLDKENETAPSSDDTAFKPGVHELFERQQQLIFTDRRDYRLIKVVVYERASSSRIFLKVFRSSQSTMNPRLWHLSICAWTVLHSKGTGG